MTPPAARRLVLLLLALALGACGQNGAPGETISDSVARPAADTIRAGESATPPGGTAEEDCEVPSLQSLPGRRVVRVYFTCADSIRGVDRHVSDSPAVLLSTLNALLAGPTDEELLAGFFSWFNRETAGMVASVDVRDSVADISFEDFSTLIPGASSSAGSEQLLGQLGATIFQFPGIREARLGFNGDCDAFWNWLQRGCQPLRPRRVTEDDA